MKAYIIDSASISPQSTFQVEDSNSEWIEHSEAFQTAQEPKYQPFIPPVLIRRMSRIVKMSMACAQHILKENGIDNVSAINVGTGLGCLRDSEKFLAQVVSNETGMLSPTSFIQSTHNTVAGQIALIGSHHCYNMTYSNGGSSFENALIDGLMHVLEGKNNILIGGADEHIPFVNGVKTELGCVENHAAGEGAGYVLLSNKASDKAVLLQDIQSFKAKTKSDLVEKLNAFLAKNETSLNAIDGFVLGCDTKFKDAFTNEIATHIREEKPVYGFKSISGEFHTAAAIGLDQSVKWLKSQKTFPQARVSGDFAKPIEKILMYNNFKGEDHAFYLLSNC